MGQLGLRAVSLCDDRVIEAINSRFVPFTTDNPQRADWSWNMGWDPGASETPSHDVQQAMEQLRVAFVDCVRTPDLRTSTRSSGDSGFLPAVQVLVRTVDGRIVEGPFAMVADPTEAVLGFLAEQSREVRPGAPCAVYESLPNVPFQADDLVMRVVARYQGQPSRDDIARLDNYGQTSSFYFMTAFQSPARDWVVLPRARWSRLLPPPGAGVGAVYTLDREVAAAVLLHFMTEDAPFDSRLRESLVQEASIVGTVEVSTPSRLLVTLEGTSIITNPGFSELTNVGPHTRVELAVKGFLELDPMSGTLRDFQIATVSAKARPPVGDPLLFDAVGYLRHHH